MCFNCDENSRALDGILQPIIPISLYAKPSPLRDWLTFYKDDGDVAADQYAREAIGTILERFFVENHAWAANLQADGAIVVPSTLRPPPHPLAVLLQERGSLPFSVTYGLTRTSANLGHNQPNAEAFAASEELRGKRILLLDDVYTSGARAQSAAYALRRVGAEVVALCVIGRRYNPGYSEQSAAVFARQSGAPFTWAVGVRDVTRTSGV
ncbi:putative amidophosphoribosyltransferase [Microbacterium sp. HM58-2]|nr:putative amidophosphoribosyltransferase [Microbacterium sp. HM58-2]